VPFHRRDRKALSDAFDIYLLILRNVENRVAQILKRDTPDWRVLHACPACTFEVSSYYSNKWYLSTKILARE
jgi:hypothetical protein